MTSASRSGKGCVNARIREGSSVPSMTLLSSQSNFYLIESQCAFQLTRNNESRSMAVQSATTPDVIGRFTTMILLHLTTSQGDQPIGHQLMDARNIAQYL